METPGPSEPDLLSLDLGRWMGRREAFGLMAGRCSAADAENLRRIRDEKLYKRLKCTWAEYCMRHLNVERRSVDRLSDIFRNSVRPFSTSRN
jgi:hypothetical protein